MQVNDKPPKVQISQIVSLITYDEKEVKSRHDRGRDVDVIF